MSNLLLIPLTVRLDWFEDERRVQIEQWCAVSVGDSVMFLALVYSACSRLYRACSVQSRAVISVRYGTIARYLADGRTLDSTVPMYLTVPSAMARLHHCRGLLSSRCPSTFILVVSRVCMVVVITAVSSRQGHHRNDICVILMTVKAHKLDGVSVLWYHHKYLHNTN